MIHIFSPSHTTIHGEPRYQVVQTDIYQFISALEQPTGLKGKSLPLTFPVEQPVGERQQRQEDESVQPPRALVRAAHKDRLEKRHQWDRWGTTSTAQNGFGHNRSQTEEGADVFPLPLWA